MAIVGSMDTWRNRIHGATDVELATLEREIEPDHALRPLISGEVLQRATDKGAAVAQTPITPTPAPDAPNIPITIPTAPQALTTVPDAPERPGGKGAPPSDVLTLANRAQTAIEGGDQKTALEIYDYGLETHGQAFVQAFNTVKHDREVSAGKSGSVPTSVVSPTEGERLASGLRSTTPPQPVPVPTDAAPPLPVVRPDPLVKVGDASGLPAASGATGYQMTLNGLPRTEGGRGGAMGYGGLPRSAAGRDDQEAITAPAPVPEPVVPSPDQPVAVLSPGGGQLPVVRPESLIKVGDAANLPTGTPPPTGYKMTLNGLPRSGAQAGREDQESPAPLPEGSVPVPGQPVAVPPPGGSQLPVVRPDPAIRVGDAAGYSAATPPSTGYKMTLNGLPRTEGGRGGAMGYGGFPGTQAGRDDQETNPPGLPSDQASLGRTLGGRAMPEPPEPAPYLPQGADAAVAGSLREAELATTKYRADQQAAANAAKATTLGAATRDAQALIEAGLTPEQAVTEALKQPGVGAVLTADDLRTSLGLPVTPKPPAETPAPAPVPSPTPAPAPAGDGGGLATLRGRTAAGTSAGVAFMDLPAETSPRPGRYPDEGTDRPGRRKDKNGKWVGEYYDPPLGPQVIPIEPPYEPGAPGTVVATPGGSGLPKPNRQMAAPPNSGSLPSTVIQTPPTVSAVPQPAVDTGTNTPSTARPALSSLSAPTSTVDTGTNTPQSDDGFMSKPDIWSFLTSAGLGMMSSQSPTFLGGVGAGGKAGLDQLTVLRKDQRDKAKNLADAEFQRERIRLGYSDQASQERRSREGNQITLQVAGINNAGADTRTDKQIAADERKLASQQEHDRRQAALQHQLRKAEADYAQHLKLTGETDSLDNKKKFFEDSGYSPEDASRMAGGFNLPTDKTAPFSPMGEKETAQALDIAAGTIIGEGGTGQQLMGMIGKLPSNIASEVLGALRTQQDSGGGAKAVMDVLRKYGITYKEGGWFTDPSLAMPKAASTSASAAPESSGGNPRYVKGQGIVR